MRAMCSMVFMATLMGLAACASDPLAANDPQPSMPYPWCADEARAAASQPMSRDASKEEREAVRDYHMSKVCQQALEQKAEIILVPMKLPGN